MPGQFSVTINMERDSQTGTHSWRVTKQKDGEDTATGVYTLQVVDLGDDGDGGRLTSCAVKPAMAPPNAHAQRDISGKFQRAVHDYVAGHVGRQSGWTRDALLGLAKEALHDVPSRYRATRARDAVKALIDGGHFQKGEGGVFLVSAPPDHPPPAPL